MASHDRKTSLPSIRWLGLVLVWLAVGLASYFLARHFMPAHTSGALEVQEAAAPIRRAEPPPSQHSPAKVTILPQKPLQQTPLKPQKGSRVEPVTEQEDAAYVVQVAAFSDSQRAQDFAQELSEDGYPARVVESGNEGAATYAVVVGQHQQRQQAQEALEELKKQYPGAFLTRPTATPASGGRERLEVPEG